MSRIGLDRFEGWQEMDQNNALNLTDKEHYIIENYTYVGDPGDCICGHLLTHHSPAAFGRACEVCVSNAPCECMRFTSSRGKRPGRWLSVVSRATYRKPQTVKYMITESLIWQREKTAKMVQHAIERIWNDD